MAQWTIKRRLLKSLIAFVAIFWIAGVVIAGLVVRHEVDEVFDSALRETTGQVVPIALHEYRIGRSSEAAIFGDAKQSLSFSRGHMHFLLRDKDGTILVASTGAPKDQLPPPTRNGFDNRGNFRYYARFLPTESKWIEVAQELHERRETAFGLWLALASPLLALLPIAAFAIWRTVGRATDPINSVSHELETRGGDYLEPIDGTGLPGELSPVADAINTLMSRLKAALDNERAFAANAAHELRNPIASARAQIQVLADNLLGTPEQARADNIASQLGQLGRRIEKLLQMSRAEAGLGQSRDRSDLFAIATLLVEDYRRRSDVGPRLRLETASDESCWVAMDQDALAIVLRNAIENAVNHGAATELIEVHIASNCTVKVVNACPAIAPDMLADLKGRFRRGALPNGPGSGLGLAIIDTIMRQAGGTVTLRSPAENRDDGFEISLTFPGAI
ncbi:ATP-binding protein [Hyphomicrobium sp. LHD-15]|uniref:sensor histidine kinase n=1 Tax=Hyphomicrobium sp. LHD-15 TaxID=3072142 RepID=UPI00280F90EF|nr:ATP-binding protein [Hyphomicrobium sp. LHD-15]MDQ8699006.1 ATP-binding protein [Hyphomicrobium sp. LHD-15]